MTILSKRICFNGSLVNCFFDLTRHIVIIKGRLGTVTLPLDRKFMFVFKENDCDFDMKFFLKRHSKFYANLEKHMRGVTFGWFTSLNLVGIQYIMKYSRRYKFLTFSLGFNSLLKYKIFKDLYVYKKKRNIFFFGWSFDKVFGVARFLRRIKCLEPYKIKGFVYSGESIKLRQGKRQKK